MRKVAIITGGSSGMGFEAAKLLGDDYLKVIASRSEEKLKKASNELKNLNIDVIYKTLDISNKESIYHFINEIKDIGDIKVLIHSAGMSPHMGDYKTIIDANAIGSIILNQEILKLMNNGVIINVSSMSILHIFLGGLSINFINSSISSGHLPPNSSSIIRESSIICLALFS